MSDSVSDIGRGALPCIVCGKVLNGVADGVRRSNQPSRGCAFGTPGHYGTTVFDPMNGDTLEINVCDDCLVKAGRAGVVLHRAVYASRGRRKDTFWKPPASVDTHPQGGDSEAAPFMSGAVPSEETGDAQHVTDWENFDQMHDFLDAQNETPTSCSPSTGGGS